MDKLKTLWTGKKNIFTCPTDRLQKIYIVKKHFIVTLNKLNENIIILNRIEYKVHQENDAFLLM